MAFPTNFTSECTGFFICYAKWLNTITDGAFWSMFLVAFAVVLFLATARYGTVRAFGFAAFGSGIIAFYLLFEELILWYFASIFFVALGIGLVIMRMAER